MKHNIRCIANAVVPWCQQQPVSLCVLFGSQATGQTHPHSDVDLAVWPAQTLSVATRLEWVVGLETRLDQDMSLVIVSPDLDPVLQFEIARQGYLIFEAYPGLWDEKRLELWHAYNDSLPFRRAARQRLHEFATEVRNAP
ncbi:MAG: nucleotidyltransferase domain-containing protein [Anaerolineae bacterium]|nr:nucleotidyltransferase domain-containing protein [Anaerolineae bacterium]